VARDALEVLDGRLSPDHHANGNGGVIMNSEPYEAGEDGLLWLLAGGKDAVTKDLFRTLISVMSAPEADRFAMLERSGFTHDDGSKPDHIYAEHPSGFSIGGDAGWLTAVFCYWEEYDPEFAADSTVHAQQQDAFDGAYDAVRAVGLAALGEPAVQGRDPGWDPARRLPRWFRWPGGRRAPRPRHQWSVWRAGDVLATVYQSDQDPASGLSIQLTVVSHPADAAFNPTTPFSDWLERAEVPG
jgi:hypothetical protein